MFLPNMAEEPKRISFGFNKSKKQLSLLKPPHTSRSDFEYVDSFDGAKGKFSFKGSVRGEEPVKKELVIPLIGTRTTLEVIKLRLENKKLKNGEEKDKKNDGVEVKAEEKTDSVKKNDLKSQNITDENKAMSIEDMAAKEILSDLQNDLQTEKSAKTLVIKQSGKVSKTADEMEIDYENIAVTEFGLAMLRGMGWTPETGIGKDKKVVPVVAPKLRPKGLGLGADKVMANKASQDPDLTISIKGYVKFASGTFKGNYGQVEAMDDDTGRVTVKLALGGVVSASEVLLIPVTENDYEKNSKLINPVKCEDIREEARSECETKIAEEAEPDSSHRRTKEDKNDRYKKERHDRSRERDQIAKRKDEERNLKRKKRHPSSDSSRSRSPDSSKHRKRKKSSREERSEDRKHKKSKSRSKSKSKKKKKKKKRHSDHGMEDSDERSHKKEKSSHHHHRSQSKRK